MKTRVSIMGWVLALLMPPAGSALAQPASPQPGAPAARPPQVWAVLIGISQYSDPQLPDSPASADQAAQLLQWFRAAGWDDDHQLLLKDFGTNDPGLATAPASSILPTRRNLDWAIDTWLLPRAQPGDLVVIYFAGQGGSVVARKTPRSEPTVDHYLLPIDGLRNNAAGSGWPLDRVVDQCALRRLRVVCWLGTGVGPAPVPALAAPPASGNSPALSPTAGRDWLRRLTRWPGVTVWLASKRPMGFGQAVDPSIPFTKKLIETLGDPASTTRPNLADCLRRLQQDSQLGVQGFEAAGQVPPDLSLWHDEFNRVVPPPRPEMVLQTGHADQVTALACSADQRLVFSASLDSTVRAWSLLDGALLHVWTGQTVGATALGLSRDDRWLVMGGGRGTVQVADLRDFTLVSAPRPPHTKRVELLAMLPDGQGVISVDRDGNAALTNMTASPLDPKPWPAPGARCLEIVCGGRAEQGAVVGRFGDGTVKLFDAGAGAGVPVTVGHGRPSALAVAPDGRAIAVGDEEGRLTLRDLARGTATEHQAAKHPIRRLAVSSTGWILISHDKGVRLMSPMAGPAPASGQPTVHDLADRPAASMTFSSNGRYLALCEAGPGALKAWRIESPGAPKMILDDPRAEASALAFAGDGHVLVTGGLRGRIATRSLEAEDAGAGPRSWHVVPSAGKVSQIAASASRRTLLALSDRFQAKLWDLKERTCRLLPEAWTSAGLIDDDQLVLTGAMRNKTSPGKLVRARYDRDRARFDLDPAFFARTEGGFTVPEQVAFEVLTLSPDRARVAAAASPAQPPLVCVWDTKTGRLTHWINHLDNPARSLGFNADGSRLLTGGDSPDAALWNLAAPGEIKAPEVVFQDANAGDANVTCVAVRPGQNQAAIGHSNGQVNLWSWDGKAARLDVPQLVQGVFAGAVKALAFADEGRKLAAAGDGATIWLGSLENQPGAVDDLDALRPHHFEQVNSLLAWSDPSMLISASDDTTVRFWDLKRKSLWGTFTASVPHATGDANSPVEWVFYTPDGFFDASAGGQKLVRFRHGKADPLERFEETHYRFGLGEALLIGQVPRGKDLDEPPPVAILEPSRPDPGVERSRLMVTIGDADWTDVALYHNDKPIPTGLDPAKKPFPSQFPVDVKLVKGVNRFSVMASRQGSFPSLSDPVEMVYDGPMDPGRVHVLALGVGNYERRQLKYAQRDASRISEVLKSRGQDRAGKSGMRFYLRDEKVTAENIENAFDQIAAVVEERPQDKVVVFLAGHTGVFDSNRFCLLLPGYPFPKEEPELVAVRGDAPAAGEGAALDPDRVLPYSIIALNLMRLKALDRLVIVDACQAETILSDPQVAAIQKWMEVQNRKSRTSYLMAARRGEPALEVDPLGHGLFTYTLLRGLGALETRDEPEEITRLNLPANADEDGDGILSTTELDTFVARHLKEIARLFPDLVASREAQQPADRPRGASSRLVQHPVLQSFGTPFRLVPLSDR